MDRTDLLTAYFLFFTSKKYINSVRPHTCLLKHVILVHNALSRLKKTKLMY